MASTYEIEMSEPSTSRCELGCWWGLDGTERARVIGGEPANRRAVLATFPAADLLPP